MKSNRTMEHILGPWNLGSHAVPVLLPPHLPGQFSGHSSLPRVAHLPGLPLPISALHIENKPLSSWVDHQVALKREGKGVFNCCHLDLLGSRHEHGEGQGQVCAPPGHLSVGYGGSWQLYSTIGMMAGVLSPPRSKYPTCSIPEFTIPWGFLICPQVGETDIPALAPLSPARVPHFHFALGLKII